ncbi:MAG: ABC transporter permease [Candidatus Pacebacteria bacterium]|nr:ABC transporter permease [Candidatus Paceibacterota bacterium]
MITAFKKIIKYGWFNFCRHSVLSFATIFILVLTLLLVNAFFLLQYSTNFLILRLEEKVDMSIFLEEDISKEGVLFVKNKIVAFPGVTSVEYISADLALERFIERFRHNPEIMAALDVVPFNPIPPSLSVRAENPAKYEKVAYFLRTELFDEYIDRVDFDPVRRQVLIDRLFAITANINTGVTVLGLILALIAILVTFNTISLAIYNAKNEISIMRLVGASNKFIKGPFIIQGILIGTFSALIAVAIFGLIVFSFNPEIMFFADGLNLWKYFLGSLGLIFLTQLLVGVILGVISSLIAIRKHLKV